MTISRDERDRLRKLADAATIPGFPGYEVRRDGTVWSSASNWRGYGKRPLVPVMGAHGYPKVRMNDESGIRRNRYVHRLVAQAFLRDPLPGEQVRHLNGDRSDAKAANLAWGTAAQNAADRDGHGTTARGSRNGYSKLTEEQVKEVRRLRTEGLMYKEIEALTGIDRRHVGSIIRRRVWAHVD